MAETYSCHIRLKNVLMQIGDHHQSTAKIGEIFDKMREAVFPQGIDTKEFRKFLFAVQHVERYPAKEIKGGRPPRFSRELVLGGSSKCKAILQNETAGRISLLYYISNSLPALSYPHDIRAALDLGKIGLADARTLARINKKNLGEKVKRRPVDIRRELLNSHLKRGGTQKELRERVSERLGTTAKARAKAVSFTIAENDLKVDELLELTEFDTQHLLWEEIKNLVFITREIDGSLIDDDSLKEILDDLGKIISKILKFKPEPETITIKL